SLGQLGNFCLFVLCLSSYTASADSSERGERGLLLADGPSSMSQWHSLSASSWIKSTCKSVTAISTVAISECKVTKMYQLAFQLTMKNNNKSVQLLLCSFSNFIFLKSTSTTQII